jgi:hypothetical protein
MTDLEHRLRDLSRIEPAADLDQRLSRTFADARTRTRLQPVRTGIPVPLAIGLCGVCLVAGLALRPWVGPSTPSLPTPPSSIVIEVPMTPALERALIRPTERRETNLIDLSFVDPVSTDGPASPDAPAIAGSNGNDA